MISDNINKKASDVNDEIQRFQAGEITEKELKVIPELETKSTQAILEGQGKLPESTPGWIAYMSLFATSEAELNRLIPRDDTVDEVRQIARAYLVANGKCGMGTTRNLPNNVATKLDLP